MANVILWSVLLIWLLICMIHDLRTRQVPLKLTLIPLICAGIYALFQQAWTPVILTACLICLSDFKPQARRLAYGATIALFMAIFDTARLVQVGILFTVWLLWELGAMGGADAKLLMVITLVIPQPAIFLFIAVMGGLQGVVGLVMHKQTVPYILAIFSGASLYALNTFVLKIL